MWEEVVSNTVSFQRGFLPGILGLGVAELNGRHSGGWVSRVTWIGNQVPVHVSV